jgi:hypothetical protein
MTAGVVQTNDGVAIVTRGDLLCTVWRESARFQRTKWLFDVVDQYVVRSPGPLAVLMIVLSTAEPPDGPARAENTARLRKLGPAIRRVVTVPVGDAFFLNVVRTVMRTMFLIQGQGRIHFVCATVSEGIDRVVEAASRHTPTPLQIDMDLRAMCDALDVSSAQLGARRGSPEAAATVR